MAISLKDLVGRIVESSLLTEAETREVIGNCAADQSELNGEQLARELVKQNRLTKFQAEQIYAGKGKSLTLGNYVILDKLGQGGMGMVLKARHKRMGRVVALKVMSPAAVKSTDAVKRFHREVQTAAKLIHPNIVTAFDADEDKGTHFLVMEYVEGNDLSQLVKKSGAISVEQAIECILQAARGLAHAHAQGVVHRDIKPANLLLDKHGTVKILDMGLARLESGLSDAGAVSSAGLTQSGTIMGTVDYMSPEQAEDTRHADARADIYSLGCSLFYLLTGRVVYGGETMMKKLLAHREAAIPSLVDAIQSSPVAPRQDRRMSFDVGSPNDGRTGDARSAFVSRSDTATLAALDSVFRKMVAKRPGERYQSMNEVIADLERCRSGEAATVTMNAVSGESSSGYELQKFLRQISGEEGSQVTSATAAGTFGTSTTPVDGMAETMLLSNNSAGTDPQTELTSATGQHDARASGRAAITTRSRVVLVAVGVVALLFGGWLIFRTPRGAMQIEITDEQIEVTLGETGRSLRGTKTETVRLPVGKHVLHVKLGETTLDTPEITVAKGEPVEIKVEKVGNRVRVMRGKEFLVAKQLPKSEDRNPRVSAVPPPPPLAKAPFDAQQARAHQEAWAKHLGMKVETLNSVGQTMILIPPGEFLMGSSDKQVEAALKVADEIKADPGTKDRIQKAERPQHKVIITKPFLMSSAEVTIGQFKKFVETSKYVTEAEQYGFGDSGDKVLSDKITDAQKQRNWRTPGYAVDDNSPAAQITWNDAVAYCQWLSDQEKKTYRLPTEAEYEYACRAGTTTQYSFGDDYNELPKYGWHNKNVGGKSQPVGTLLPNPFGLFDMHGNLYEWCGDWYDEKWYEKASTIDPIGPSDGSSRVIRGGHWNLNASHCRSAYRSNSPPSNRYVSNGFRCVMVLAIPVAATSASPATSTGTPAPKLQLRQKIKAHSQRVNTIAIHPREPMLVSASSTGDVFVWDATEGKKVGEFKAEWKWPPALLVFSPDGRRLLCSDDLRSLKEWDWSQRSLIRSLDGRFGGIAFSRDGKLLATGAEGTPPKGPGALYDGETLVKRMDLGTPAPPINCVAFSPEGRWVATGGHSGRLTIFQASDGKSVFDSMWDKKLRVAFADDGTLFVCGDKVPGIHLYDATDPANPAHRAKGLPKLGELLVDREEVPHFAWLPGRGEAASRYLIAANKGVADLQLWDVRERKHLASLPGHAKPITTLAVSSDGRLVATGSEDGDVVLWDVVSVASTKRVFATDEWIDVLPLIDPAFDKSEAARNLMGKNDWRVEQGELRYYGDEKSGKLFFPVRYRGRSLEWEIEVTRTKGNTGFNTDIPVPGGFVPIQMGNGSMVLVNERLSEQFRVVTGQRAKLRFRVTQDGPNDRLEIFANDAPIADWKGDLSKLKTAANSTELRNQAEHNGLFVGGPSDYTFHAIRVRMLNGGTAELIRPAINATSPNASTVLAPYDIWTSSDYEWTTPENLGPTVNSDADDGSPCLSADGLTLIFDSFRSGGVGNSDLWVCRRAAVDAPWSAPENLGPNVNSNMNEDNATLSHDGLTLMFHSSRNPKEEGRLWYCTRPTLQSAWSPAKKTTLPLVAGDAGDLSPELSGDGLSLLLALRNQPGIGGADLWESRRKTVADGWGPPQHLSAPLNSPQDDVDATLSADGCVLVFGSRRPDDKRKGLWFSVRSKVDAPWSEPKRIGKPIDTHFDDVEPELSADGQTLIFASWGRTNGIGKSDLWMSRRVKKAASDSANTFTNTLGMEFVRVPKGKSWLGGGGGKPGDKAVEFQDDFYLGKFEVTQGEWLKVVGANPSDFSREGNRKDDVKAISDTDLKRFPVESVSWQGCQDFIAKLNALTKESGWEYRLPTEAEWEYAARGGPLSDPAASGFDFYFGQPTNQLLPTQANFAGTDLKRPDPIGKYAPNPLGLHDMFGNVREWCSDEELHPGDKTWRRAVRGGSWAHPPNICRAVQHDSSVPVIRLNHLGLRVARVRTASTEAAVFTNSLGMEFVRVPKGKSWLGGGGGKPGTKEVEFKDDFYLGKFEVTQEEWQKIMGANPSHFSRNNKGGEAVKSISDAELNRFPVETVTWDDCQQFLRLLNQKANDPRWEYRLPTEAEWEYACRGGPLTKSQDSGFDFYLDTPTNTLATDQANMKGSPFDRTCKAGLYRPNPLGLYDMHGNVQEWCDDRLLDDKGAAARAHRGGSWTALSPQAGRRFGLLPTSVGHSFIGLRVARVRAATQTAEWKSLFNGKDLTGWVGDPARFSVINGELKPTGGR